MKKYKSKIWLKEQIDSGKTFWEIGHERDISPKTVSFWAKKFGIAPFRDQKRFDSKYSKDWLIAQVNTGKSDSEIGSICGFSKNGGF